MLTPGEVFAAHREARAAEISRATKERLDLEAAVARERAEIEASADKATSELATVLAEVRDKVAIILRSREPLKRVRRAFEEMELGRGWRRAHVAEVPPLMELLFEILRSAL